jgi:hypothetical protein
MSVGTQVIGSTTRRINPLTVLVVGAAFALGIGIGVLIEYEAPEAAISTPLAAPAAQAMADVDDVLAAEHRAIVSSPGPTSVIGELPAPAITFPDRIVSGFTDVDEALANEHRALIGV